MRLLKSTLVVAPHLGALTTSASALTELTARRGRVHIAVHGEAPPGTDVSAFSGKFRRLTIGLAPNLDRWAELSATVRGCLDCWRFLDARDEGAYRRALQEASPLASRIARNRLLRAGLVRPLIARILRLLVRVLPPPPPIVDFLKAHNPDLLVVAPLFGIGSVASDYIRAANTLGIPTIGLPARWDDLTSGALPHVLPDCMALWSREQRRQAVEILGVPARRTAVIGACLPLDAAGAVTTTREEFCRRHGLDPARSVLLLAAGSRAIERRHAQIRQWIDSLRSSSDPRIRDAGVIVYSAPPPGVQQKAYPQMPEAVLPRFDTDFRKYAADIAEALQHADAVIAMDMSLVLEAAARARPVVALLWPDGGDEELTRFCAEVAEQRGWPSVARSLGEHAEALAGILDHGLDRAHQAAARTLVRPHGTDLLPGFLMWARLVQEVADRLAAPRAVPGWVSLLRRIIAPLASYTGWRAAGLPARRDNEDFVSVLFGVPSAEALFLHQPILRALAERGHRLAIVFTRRVGQTEDAYSRIRCDVPGVIQAGLLSRPEGMWGEISQGLLGMSAYLSMLDLRGKGDAQSWLVRLSLAVVPRGARPIARIARLWRVMPRPLRRFVARLDRAIPSSTAARDLLVQQKPDVVLALPDSDVITALESAGAEADLLRAARSLGIPAIASAGGGDGQLHATLLQSKPPAVFVWNDTQRAAVLRDLRLPSAGVLVTGGTPLERCLDEPPVVGPDEFRALLGLPPGRAFAFFAGSVGVLSEPGREVDLVRRWVTSLRASTDHRLRDLPVLIRPAVRSPRWRSLDFTGVDNVVMIPRAYERSGELDAVLLAESVRYAAVTVGIGALSLTMAAALGKPAVAVVRPDGAKTVHDTGPVEFLWSTSGSSVVHAETLEDVNRHVRTALGAPQPDSSNPFFKTMVRSGSGERPSVVAADHVERLGRRSRRRTRPRVSLGALVMRVPLLMLAGVVNLTGRLLGKIAR
jgi:hypothetical protein